LRVDEDEDGCAGRGRPLPLADPKGCCEKDPDRRVVPEEGGGAYALLLCAPADDGSEYGVPEPPVPKVFTGRPIPIPRACASRAGGAPIRVADAGAFVMSA